MPACFLGCVGAWNAAREPEIAGAAVLHNASPIGKQWKVALSPRSTGGVPASRLQDVTVYLRLAVKGGKA
jgi:hypothetical protein